MRNGWILILVMIFLPIQGGSAFAGQGAQATQAESTFRDCPDCPEMVVIQAGSFLMGSSEADTTRDLAAVPESQSITESILGFTDRKRARKFMAYEHPQHPVTISKDFALGRFLVTKGEFAAFVRETKYTTGSCYISPGIRGGGHGHLTSAAWSHPGFDQTDHEPVVCVTWTDAKVYIDWLNKKVGNKAPDGSGGLYRLPSEAEWEYAARAGTQTARWWGNDIGVGNANCNGCYKSEPSRGPAIVNGVLIYPPCRDTPPPPLTVPVDRFPANPFGLYDVLGNAGQWTEDCWSESYKSAPADGGARTGGNCRKRALRGSAWSGSPWTSRAASRGGISVDMGYNTAGFRVAKTLR